MIDIIEMTTENQALLDRFRTGEKVGLARAISLVEDERPGFQAFLHVVLETPRFAKRVGLTGPPGEHQARPQDGSRHGAPVLS